MTENVNVYNLLQRWNKLYETITVRSLFSVRVRVMVLNATFNNISGYIMAVSFMGGGNWSTRRKPLTYRKSLTNFVT
jgi:hypothetical protein